jgi:hypothetical protein
MLLALVDPCPSVASMDLDQRLRDARDEDARLWEALLSAGLVEGRDLTVDSFFAADDEASAHSLSRTLADDGAAVSCEPFQTRAGLFRRVTRWSVQATTTVPGVTLAAVQALTERMV